MSEGVRKRGKTWSYYFDAAKVDGKRNKVEKSGFRTKKDAMEARTAAVNEYNNTGRTFSPNDISVADYLDYWLENAIRKNINHGYSHNTYRIYEAKIRIHIKPCFGKYRLSAFQYSSDKVQEWVDSLKLKGLSKSTIKNCLTCLQGAMNYAVMPLKYIQNNPCLPIKIGKMPIDMDAKAHTEYVLTKEEFEAIVERFPPSNYFNISLVLPYNIGTRISETFAIDLLHDVDFKNHEVSIRNQLIKIEKTWFFKPPKYDSYRTVKIGKTLEKALKEVIKTRKINQMKYGGEFLKTYVLPDKSIIQVPADISADETEIMPLCTKDNGELLTPKSFQYCAKVIHNELGNLLFHSHSLRHTHGTVLAENGVNPKTVMERLGHKDISTTLRTYTFNTEVMQQKAVDIFEKAMNS